MSCSSCYFTIPGGLPVKAFLLKPILLHFQSIPMIQRIKTPFAILLYCWLAVFGFNALSQPLPRSTPEAEGISSEGILKLVEALDKEPGDVHSFMLVRNGKIVADGWWEPYGKNDPHILWSLSKSFTSAAIGMAVEEGLLSLNDKVISFFPDQLPENVSDNLKAMRIRDLLIMTSGHDEDTINKLFGEGGKGMVKAFLALPVEHKPGIHFTYNTGATFMLSAILQKVAGEKLVDYLKPRLFDPLGIKNPKWHESPDGINFGGFGLFLTTEEIAKFGQLYLQKGEWNDRQLVPEDWVISSGSRQVRNGSNPNEHGEQGYGYQFWLNRDYGYRADGAFGQNCIIIPEHNLVLVTTSGTSEAAKILDQVWENLFPAVSEKALPENPEALAKLNRKISQLKVPPVNGKKAGPTARKASGKVYHFEDNDLGLESVIFDFDKKKPCVVFSTAKGKFSIPYKQGGWKESETSFMHQLSILPEEDLPVASSAAWVSDDTLELIIRYTSTQLALNFRFKFGGDLLVLEGDQSASFGPLELPRIMAEVNP